VQPSADFGQRLTYLIRRVNGALSAQLDEYLRQDGLTQAQLSALAQLDVAAPHALSGAELAQRSGVTAQSMSAAVVGLLDRELIERHPNPGHGRKLDVTLTPAGSALLRDSQARTGAAEDDVDLGLDAEELAQLREYLQRMMRALGLFLPEVSPPGTRG
jgi:DNA-binding MarR family transcriptional regulator